jgi:predicted nucleic acid-binding protein
MHAAAIVDTGPLVAFLDKAQRHHHWAADRIKEFGSPLLVCEPVLTEAMHLLAHTSRGQKLLFGLLENGALDLAFRVDEHLPELCRLHQKDSDRPMSFADACIVRMAEIHDRHAVFTTDSDFAVYRKHGRSPLTLIHPVED